MYISCDKDCSIKQSLNMEVWLGHGEAKTAKRFLWPPHTATVRNVVRTKLFLYLKNKRPTWCHLLHYFTSYVLNMFRTLIYPSSGTCDCAVELPHLSYRSWFDVCWSFGVVRLEWYPCCRLQPLQPNHTETPTHIEPRTHDQCGNSTEQSQSPDDGYINARNMLSA